MSKDKEKKEKRGRPKRQIDWKTVELAAKANSSGAKIARGLGISYDCLRDRFFEEHPEREFFSNFSDYLDSKKDRGEMDLLIKQHEQALDGDKTLLVWLGKSRLGQMETKEINHKGNVLPPINIINASEKNNGGE